MKAQRLIFLIAFMFVCIIAGIPALGGDSQADNAGEDKSIEPAADTTAAADTVKADVLPEHRFIAYYFHSTRRCVSCKKIEAYSAEAVHEGFGKELESGLLEWQVVNVDLGENTHFTDDYKLYTKSVILSEMDGGEEVRWKNLDKVWTLLGDKAAFKQYIIDEIGAYLEKK